MKDEPHLPIFLFFFLLGKKGTWVESPIPLLLEEHLPDGGRRRRRGTLGLFLPKKKRKDKVEDYDGWSLLVHYCAFCGGHIHIHVHQVRHLLFPLFWYHPYALGLAASASPPPPSDDGGTLRPPPPPSLFLPAAWKIYIRMKTQFRTKIFSFFSYQIVKVNVFFKICASSPSSFLILFVSALLLLRRELPVVAVLIQWH